MQLDETGNVMSSITKTLIRSPILCCLLAISVTLCGGCSGSQSKRDLFVSKSVHSSQKEQTTTRESQTKKTNSAANDSIWRTAPPGNTQRQKAAAAQPDSEIIDLRPPHVREHVPTIALPQSVAGNISAHPMSRRLSSGIGEMANTLVMPRPSAPVVPLGRLPSTIDDESPIQLSNYAQTEESQKDVLSKFDIGELEKVGTAQQWDNALGDAISRFAAQRPPRSIPLETQNETSSSADNQQTSPPSRVLPPTPQPDPSVGQPEVVTDPKSLYKYYDVPVMPRMNPDQLQLRAHGDQLTLVSRGAPLSTILSMISQQHGLNIVAGEDLNIPVTVSLNRVPLQDALDTIIASSGCTWVRQRNIIVVSKVTEESNLRPHIQGREVRVIPLNFVAATDVEKVVSGLLSPIGKIFITESSPTDRRRTTDQIVVEDLPEYIARIEDYIAQTDHPPRQVLIEAHILQIELKDENRHGVNFEYLAEIAGADVTFSTRGFANPFAAPASFIDIDGTDLDALLEMIQNTTDSKTLASPKVLVLNGQDAKIQLGERIGFLVTTTTQTATLENVEFLDVGVVLNVTPQISNDGQILMKVKPEVSRGGINLETGLPDKETTEVETTVMLPDGRGIVIGGLIQEADIENQQKIPVLGDMWLVGRAFQRRIASRERSEIVIALMPRVVPYSEEYKDKDEFDFHRATNKILDPGLRRLPRTEPVLPDACRNPRHVRLDRLPHFVGSLKDCYPPPIQYFFPAASENDKCWDCPKHSRTHCPPSHHRP